VKCPAQEFLQLKEDVICLNNRGTHYDIVYSNEDKEKYKLLLEYDNEYHELFERPVAKPVKPNEEEKAKKEKEEEEERKKRQAEEEKEKKRRAEEEEKKRLDEEQKKRQAEEEKKRQAEDEKKKKEEEEQKKKKEKEDEDARLAIIAKQQEDDDKKKQAERIKEKKKVQEEQNIQNQSGIPNVEPQSNSNNNSGLNTIPINNIGGIIRTVPAKEEDKLTSNENEKELKLK